MQSTLRTVIAAIEESFVVLPITSAVAGSAVGFSNKFPKDATDRLIAATALANSLQLITADRATHHSNEIPYVW